MSLASARKASLFTGPQGPQGVPGPQGPQGPTGTTTPGSAGQFFATNSTPATQWVTLSGDALGDGTVAGKITVTGLQGRAVDATLPGNNYALQWNGTKWVSGLINLAAGVTGVLPVANQAAQTLAGDVTGNTGASTVVQLSGSAGTVTVTASTLSFSQASTIKTTAGALTIDSASTLNLGTSTASGVNVGNFNSAGNAVLAGSAVQLANGGYTLTFSALNLTANGLVNLGTSSAPFGSVSLGNSPAHSGLVAVPNATTAFAARTANGLADIKLIATDSSNEVTFGDSSNATNVIFATSGGHYWNIGGTNYASLTTGAYTSWAPVYQWGSSVLGPTITQAGTGPANGTAQSITLAPQGPNATNGTPGGVTVNLAAPTGSGSHAKASLEEGGTPFVTFAAGGSNAIYIQSNSAYSQVRITNGAGNGGFSYLAYAAGNNQQGFDTDWVNGAWVARNPTVAWINEVNGALTFAGSSGNTVGGTPAQTVMGLFDIASGSFQLGNAASLGGGTGVLGIANASGAPTTNPSGGGVFWEDSTYGLMHRGSNYAQYNIASSGFGTWSTQAALVQRVMHYKTTTSTSAQPTLTYTIPAGKSATFRVLWSCRQTTVSTAEAAGGEAAGVFVNDAGTVTAVGSGSVWNYITSGAGPIVNSPTFTVSTNTVTVNVTANSTTSFDWTLDIYILVN